MCELVGNELAQQHTACFVQAPGGSSVGTRNIALIYPGTGGCLYSCGLVNILQSVRNAVQWTSIVSPGDLSFRPTGVLKGSLCRYRDECVKFRLMAIDAFEQRLGEFDWREGKVLDTPSQLGNGGKAKLC